MQILAFIFQSRGGFGVYVLKPSSLWPPLPFVGQSFLVCSLLHWLVFICMANNKITYNYYYN